MVAEVEEAVRLITLYFFIVIEHVRSNEGQKAWGVAQRCAYEYAKDHETKIFDAEFGIVQGDNKIPSRKPVKRASQGETEATPGESPDSLYRWQLEPSTACRSRLPTLQASTLPSGSTTAVVRRLQRPAHS